MDYEIQREVDYIVDEVADFRYSRESGVNKVKQAVRAIGRGDAKTLKAAVIYYEDQCNRRNL